MDHRKLNTLSLLLSFCGFAYQSLMAKTFAVFLQEEIIGFCLSSALFIYGIGLGSRKSSNAKNPLLSLINVELILMVLGAMAPMIVTYLFFIPSLELVEFNGIKMPAGPLMMVFVILSGTISLALGYLTGFETPLLFRLRSDENNQKYLNQILAFSYFGALGASIIVPVLLIPTLEIYGSAILIALISGSICLYLSTQAGIEKRSAKITVSAFAFVLVFAIIQMPLQQLSLRVRYLGEYPKNVTSANDIKDYAAAIKNSIKVTRHLSHYQAIDLVDGSDQDGSYFSLWLNGQFQFDSRYEKSYHEAFLQGALKLSSSTPKKVLILGAGDGLLLRDALKVFSQDTELTLVELDPDVLSMAKKDSRWRLLNESSLENPRAEIITDDAFHFLRGTQRKWDAVFLDFPYPYSVELSKLYSYEFYSILKNKLSTDGFIVFDFPTNESADVINSTLKAVPYSTVIAYEGSESFIFATNSKQVGNPSALPAGYKVIPLPDADPGIVNSLFKPQLPRMWE